MGSRAVTAKLRGWRFGVFEVDLERHELRKHGVHIKLAGQPFQVLTLLLQFSGEVVSREELRALLWSGSRGGITTSSSIRRSTKYARR
jgi:DNA-binding response OmpR family regulator